MEKANAIVPAPLPPTDETQEPLQAIPVLPWWARALLVLVAAGLIAVFTIAALLNPYNEDGSPRRMATHTTKPLGLPPCTFYTWTGLPCPSCGMTTSFALLMRGDLGDSLRANAVGTLLAAFLLLLIPWGLAGAARGRLVGVRSLERALTVTVAVFLVLMLARWLVVVGLIWLSGGRP
jgi:Protein of unknown function (DUF2752)